MNVRIKQASNGQYCWRVKSANSRTIAVGGETFHRSTSAINSFLTIANKIHDMTDDEFGEFLEGLYRPVTPS